ncbi:MAG: phosphate acyltransferase [Candidatus Longimicrobiales bacterium M2_2A_002]
MAAPRSFQELRDRARAGSPVAVAVVAAGSVSALRAAGAAASDGFARPVLVGDPDAIRAAIDDAGIRGLDDARFVTAENDQAAARTAVALARDGEVGVLLKGALRTDQLMRAALDRDDGLRTGRLLSDVLLYEDTLAGETRLVGVTDGGINPAPDREALQQIVANAVEVFTALGWDRPRVALLSATEAVTEAVPSTVTARAVAVWAADALPHADVAGPLALDNALLASAAEAKGITGPVAGRADIMVTPTIEAGNILGKGVKYLGGSITAHVVVGARAPILIPSRVESAEDKLHSIALGVLTVG